MINYILENQAFFMYNDISKNDIGGCILVILVNEIEDKLIMIGYKLRNIIRRYTNE